MSRALGWSRMDPGVEKPPVRVWRDWVLFAAVIAAAVVEAAFRGGVLSPAAAILFGVGLALAALWRRTHPLTMVVLTFGGFLVIDLAVLVTEGEPFYVYAGGFSLVLVYSLFRWGTTRQAVIGLMIVLLAWFVSTTSDFSGVADAIGGLVVVLFPAALGVLIRYRGIVRAHQYEHVRSHEREVLARELHDTIAHHVSAIAIQAQAGQVLAKSRDMAGTSDTFKVIEDEASRTLTEMRYMVGFLRGRNGASPVLAQRGIADIDRLATAEGAQILQIDVEHRGELDDLRPSVQAALYRVAQESITNAKRHARHATRVHIIVDCDPEAVRLTVTDNGERYPATRQTPGYGLIGMMERVTLLGGTLEAGPQAERGWSVDAKIPRQGNPV